ncbi:hypothetical protein NMG60_11022563 [Bertholletia excelsa]
MEMEPGKLFIGGISWDTNEDRLRDYFQNFGEVVEAVIMKDRNTGRARGFGFVVFADSIVAERVVREKHMIDGRTVEAKKAVPRDDQNLSNRNSGSVQGPPGPARTRKIFVGGLPSTVTESDFKKYFGQFGTITDVVVMYDHNTQRPRGFGFITYDSEEAVDKVLVKTFHELNGKMVEVKRAIPKELSPGPSRNQIGRYNHGLSRVNNLLNAYSQGYNPRSGSITGGRSGFSPFNPSSYGTGLHLESGLSLGYGESGNFNSNIGFGRGLNPFYSSSPNRYNGSILSSVGRDIWGNRSLNYASSSANSSDFMGTGNGNSGLAGAFGNIGSIWGSSNILAQGGVTDSVNINKDIGSVGEYGRNTGNGALPIPRHTSWADAVDEPLGNIYGGGSFYGDPAWRSLSPELGGSGSFNYGQSRNSAEYIGDYSVTNRSNRGIAA